MQFCSHSIGPAIVPYLRPCSRSIFSLPTPVSIHRLFFSQLQPPRELQRSNRIDIFVLTKSFLFFLFSPSHSNSMRSVWQVMSDTCAECQSWHSPKKRITTQRHTIAYTSHGDNKLWQFVQFCSFNHYFLLYLIRQFFPLSAVSSVSSWFWKLKLDHRFWIRIYRNCTPNRRDCLRMGPIICIWMLWMVVSCLT